MSDIHNIPNITTNGGGIINSGNKQYRCPGGSRTITADCTEIYQRNR